MGMKKDDLLECIGTVTIVTDDLLIFQGQIVREENERHHDHDECPIEVKVEREPEFIKVRLVCDPALIREDATIREIEPDLFEEGNVIRVNVNEIIAIGPSRACFDDDPPKIVVKAAE